MKNLKTYIVEAIKPPRLSAKNKELWKNGVWDEEKVMKWIEENCVKVSGAIDLSNGRINIKGNVFINDDVDMLPYPFGEVTGVFCCHRCKLRSLHNCPEIVGGNFWCYNNSNLTSLEGAPKEVGGEFDCHKCGKQFTVDDVKKVSKVKGSIWV